MRSRGSKNEKNVKNVNNNNNETTETIDEPASPTSLKLRNTKFSKLGRVNSGLYVPTMNPWSQDKVIQGWGSYAMLSWVRTQCYLGFVEPNGNPTGLGIDFFVDFFVVEVDSKIKISQL